MVLEPKNLIHLPNPPTRSFQVGEQVLAMFTNTTTFYTAVVEQVPSGKRQANYQLRFEVQQADLRTMRTMTARCPLARFRPNTCVNTESDMVWLAAVDIGCEEGGGQSAQCRLPIEVVKTVAVAAALNALCQLLGVQGEPDVHQARVGNPLPIATPEAGHCLKTGAEVVENRMPAPEVWALAGKLVAALGPVVIDSVQEPSRANKRTEPDGLKAPTVAQKRQDISRKGGMVLRGHFAV